MEAQDDLKRFPKEKEIQMPATTPACKQSSAAMTKSRGSCSAAQKLKVKKTIC